jgi:hypothetical protein
MMAVVQGGSQNPYCLIHTVGRRGITIQIYSWCGQKYPAASHDTLQMPDATPLCAACKAALSRGAPAR